ncbi:MAG: outer membrane protein assembly factor BamD [Planctomycetota bacterium]|nr:outer membrane protein assembly factor BamD [Planctomycetota bacterium]
MRRVLIGLVIGAIVFAATPAWARWVWRDGKWQYINDSESPPPKAPPKSEPPVTLAPPEKPAEPAPPAAPPEKAPPEKAPTENPPEPPPPPEKPAEPAPPPEKPPEPAPPPAKPPEAPPPAAPTPTPQPPKTEVPPPKAEPPKTETPAPKPQPAPAAPAPVTPAPPAVEAKPEPPAPKKEPVEPGYVPAKPRTESLPPALEPPPPKPAAPPPRTETPAPRPKPPVPQIEPRTTRPEAPAPVIERPAPKPESLAPRAETPAPKSAPPAPRPAPAPAETAPPAAKTETPPASASERFNAWWDGIAKPSDETMLFERGRAELSSKNYRACANDLKSLIKNFPASRNREEAMWLRAAALMGMEDYMSAFDQYEQLITQYAGSPHYRDALLKEIEIADTYLGPTRRKVLGIPLTSGDTEAIEILRKVYEHQPTGDLADDIVQKIADYYWSKEQWAEAEDYYDKYCREYPNGPVVRVAELRRAKCAIERCRGSRYDTTCLQLAYDRLRQFQQKYPEDAEREGVADQLAKIRLMQAEALYETATNYYRSGRPLAAAYYVERLQQKFPDTIWCEMSRQFMADISMKKEDLEAQAEPKGKETPKDKETPKPEAQAKGEPTPGPKEGSKPKEEPKP